ncbi:MAG TPA: YceI family protein [Chitinophagaceae bacterium]|nr:YceI family protein [Chitinophagaceae bacterium]
MAPLQRISAYALLFFTLTAIMSFSLNTGNNKIKFGSNNIAAAQTVNLTIKGTSTLHDWEMKSDKGRVEVVLGLAGNTKLTGLTGLKFSVEAESLKSEKTMMDNNAYKALKTNSAKYISFLATAATINQVNETTYQIRAFGKLTVAGTTKETDVIADVKYNNAEKSFIVTGTKKLKMTDYNVKPPSFMLGTVKTGDDISIIFKTKLAQ